MKNRVRDLRTAMGWSQADLADKLEVSRQSINAIETGKYDPSLPLAMRLARIFKKSIESIFDDEQLITEKRKTDMFNDRPPDRPSDCRWKNFLLVLALIYTLGMMNKFMHAQAVAAPSTHFTVTVEGTGPDVFLLPGLASGRDTFDAEAKLLSPRYRLHRVQLNGFGTQAALGNAEGAILAPVVEDLHRYIAAQKLAKPAVIGHSMGGLLALMLAEQYPADAGRVLIVDSLPFIGLLFDPSATVAAIEPRAAQFRDMQVNAKPEEYALMEEMAMKRLIKNQAAGAAAIKTAQASNASVVARAMYEDMTTDVRPGLAKIVVPVTVMYPYDAAMGERSKADAMYTTAYAAVPKHTMVAVEGSYHFIMLDQPEKFHAAVVEFLK